MTTIIIGLDGFAAIVGGMIELGPLAAVVLLQTLERSDPFLQLPQMTGR